MHEGDKVFAYPFNGCQVVNPKTGSSSCRCQAARPSAGANRPAMTSID
jgi:hypothetical protein